jgi:hypothetical protein
MLKAPLKGLPAIAELKSMIFQSAIAPAASPNSVLPVRAPGPIGKRLSPERENISATRQSPSVIQPSPLVPSTEPNGVEAHGRNVQTMPIPAATTTEVR